MNKLKIMIVTESAAHLVFTLSKLVFSITTSFYITHIRAATRGKTGKTVVLPGFCEMESGGGSGGTSVIWLPLW